jgi:hypothetical protein
VCWQIAARSSVVPLPVAPNAVTSQVADAMRAEAVSAVKARAGISRGWVASCAERACDPPPGNRRRADDDAPTAIRWSVRISLIGNQLLGGVATAVTSYPASAVVLIGGTRSASPVYSVAGTPEGQVTAPVGATAVRRDGGAGTTFYVEESGTGNTGWVAK